MGAYDGHAEGAEELGLECVEVSSTGEGFEDQGDDVRVHEMAFGVAGDPVLGA